MKYLLLILSMSILLSAELEVDGDLKVTGSIESATIDSLKAVIADLQAQLAALQGAGVLQTRVYESNMFNFSAYQVLEVELDINEITGYDLTNYSIVIYDVIDSEVSDNGNAATDFSLTFKYNHPSYGWIGTGSGGDGIIFPSGDYNFTSGNIFYHRNSTKSEIRISDGHNSGYIKFAFAITAQFPN